MFELLTGSLAVILENADVLEARVALQILKPERGQAQKLFHFGVAGIPEMTVVTGIFQQHFMSADRSHAVVETVAAPQRFALDVIERVGMDEGTR
jgi:hypothetical protein